MKVKTVCLAACAMLLFCTISCADKDISDIYVDNSGQIDKEQTSEYNNELTYKMQSDSKLLLNDRIVCKGSEFMLDLSEEEAKALHIPTEMYRKCVQYVEELNGKSEN